MKNGLYSIHVTLLDGRTGKGSGVILFRDGQILGGDDYLIYTGSYTVKGDTFKCGVPVERHRNPAGSQAQPNFWQNAAQASRYQLAGPLYPRRMITWFCAVRPSQRL